MRSQTQAPKITRLINGSSRSITVGWALALAGLPAVLALLPLDGGVFWLVAGLLLFGVVFAINSSWHSYLIVRFARSDGVSMDVGFYYMANTMGRLLARCCPAGCIKCMVSRFASGSPRDWSLRAASSRWVYQQTPLSLMTLPG